MRVQSPGTHEFKQSYWSKALNWSQGLRRGFKTKKWQIEAKPTRHMFWMENQLVQTRKESKKESS
jgi:hypothetical protein